MGIALHIEEEIPSSILRDEILHLLQSRWYMDMRMSSEGQMHVLSVLLLFAYTQIEFKMERTFS